MIEDNDTLWIKSTSGDLEVECNGSINCGLETFRQLKGKKFYLVNLLHIECIVGEWNKDKTEYGARIFFVSGNSVWCDAQAAGGVFHELGGEKADDKFWTVRERESKK